MPVCIFIPQDLQEIVNNQDEFSTIESRNNGRNNQPFSSDQQQNGRFLFNSGTGGNLFLKTATFGITSTCTAVTFVTCIAFNVAVAPPVPACNRRKRDSGYDASDLFLDGDSFTSQYPIFASKVML